MNPEADIIIVTDRDGNPHRYDADDFCTDEAHLLITKDGRAVAVYAPGGYVSAHRAGCRAGT